ncbi:MAG: hypothetical protein Q8S27_21995 [Hoeflea sp.]|uniref:hypothetical protein n=1 Tax=Hoeflea sp. TaxID=1940281 RepID=UPI0027303138|nr:hypothetical protein [Hoeflea sp.]MDP2120510.1 hypothetical protein [Hoeflea sp.]MDP3527253.1 hypothetical protein [Hoeflea sp.]MDZ7603468.1 hypothetical protein [Hoeflea sp.]
MTTLARRFIIICLVFTIFALLMAAAVANGGQRERGWHSRAIDACLIHHGLACGVSR